MPPAVTYQVANQPVRLSSLLLPYARAVGWDDAALAEAIGCSLELLSHLLDERNPFPSLGDDPRPRQELAAIAESWGVDIRRLEGLLYAGQVYSDRQPALQASR